MLSLQDCKNELTKNDERYTDEEIKVIRELLYQVSCIEFEKYKNIIPNEKSNNIRQSINRRAARKRA